MVKLRKVHKKLKIVLCSVLGVIVAAGGIFGIGMMLHEDAEPTSRPGNVANTKTDPDGVTVQSLLSSKGSNASGDLEEGVEDTGITGEEVLSYLAYTLDNQSYYHAKSSTVSVTSFSTTHTTTYKDFSVDRGEHGVLMVSDISYTPGYSSKNMAGQFCYPRGVNDSEAGSGYTFADTDYTDVYRRSGSGAGSGSTATSNITWNDDAKYYYRGQDYIDVNESYELTYGQFASELTVYILNASTLDSYSEITDNGDGTYSQTYNLDINEDSAIYYYQFVMKTNGGLSSVPVFNYVNFTVTFNENWQIVKTVAHENTTIYYGINVEGDTTVTTEYTYASSEDEMESAVATDSYSYKGHLDYYDSYYKDKIGTLEPSNSDVVEDSGTDVITVLTSTFSDMDQTLDLTLELDDVTYYGRLYLSIDLSDMSNLAENIKVKAILSADKDLTRQDLYIEYLGGEVNVYYSTQFALSVDINNISSVINKFSSWISSLTEAAAGETGTELDGTTSSVSVNGASSMATAQAISLEDITGPLLGGMSWTDNGDGTGVIYIDISDMLGIDLLLAININIETKDKTTTYTFVSATGSGLAYDGEEIPLNLILSSYGSGDQIGDRNADTAVFDIADAIDSVYTLLQAEYVQLDLSIDGSQLYGLLYSLLSDSGYADYLSVIEDLDIEISAVADVNNLLAELGINITYTDDSGNEYTVIDLSVIYDYDGTGYGTAYVTLTNLMGISCNANVYCDIADLADGITELIKAISGSSASTGSSEVLNNVVSSAVVFSEEEGAGTASIASVVNSILNMDFGKLIYIQTASGSMLSIDLDLDYLIEVIGADIAALTGIDLTSLSLGTVGLSYSYTDSTAADGTLTLTTGLGVNGTLNAASAATTIVKPSSYLDLCEVVDQINAAVEVVYEIIEANGASFVIDTTVNDGKTNAIDVAGSGEVLFDSNGNFSYVAIDLTLTTGSGVYYSGSSTATTLTFQLIYIAANCKQGAEDPFLYVAINNYLLTVSYSDYTSVADAVNEIVNLVNSLTGSTTTETTTTGGSTQSAAETAESGTTSYAYIIDFILEIFFTGDYADSLTGGLQSLVNNLAISAGSSGLVVTYGNDITLTVAAAVKSAEVTGSESKLALNGNISGFELEVEVYPYDSASSVYSTLMGGFTATEDSEYTEYTVKQMVNYIYTLLLQEVDTVDLSALFGSSAYYLEFTLDGDLSGESALGGVYVDAEVYAGSVTVDSKTLNLYSIELEIEVGSFTMAASVIYYDGYLYVSITDINGTEFTDLAIKASADDIYTLVETVVELVLDEDVLSEVTSLLGSATTDTTTTPTTANTQATVLADSSAGGSTSDTLYTVLNAILTTDWANLITIYTSGETDTIAVVDITGLLSAFGVDTGVGSLTVNKITTDGKVTGIAASMADSTTSTTWITLSAYGTNTAKYNKIDTTTSGNVSSTLYTSAYQDISFVAQLVDDALTFVLDGVKTAEDNTTYAEYTLTGSISIPISYSIISATIDITDIELTLGYSSADGLYVNMFGYVNGSSVLTFTVSTANYIGVSYSTKTGLITFARGLNSDGSASTSTIYWAMTLEWFIDNMLDSDNSPLRFLLGTSDTAWSLVTGVLGLSISSGLGDAEEYYLYNSSSSGSSSIDIFGSSSYVASFIAMLSGETTGSYGSNDGLISQLGLNSYTDGYYAFSLGSGLLGSTLSPIYLAITRSNTTGFGKLLAYLAVDSYLTVSVDLTYQGSNYTAITQDYYALGVSTITDGTTPDLTNGSGTNTTENDWDKYIFGSLYISDGSCTYYDSYTLIDDYATVTVYEWDSENNCYVAGEVIKLRYGSTLYLYTLSGDGIQKDETTGKAIVYATDTYINTTTQALKDGYSDDNLPTSITITGDTSVYEYHTDTTVYTLTLNIIDGTNTVVDTIEYSVFAGSALPTDVYNGYTLIGGTWYTDSALTTDSDIASVSSNLTLYGKFAQTSVTINGVVYTFTAAASYNITASNTSNDYYNGGSGVNFTVSGGGYYSVSGYSDLSDYESSNNWLILESSIDGYAVIEIQSGVFKNTSIVNVIIPESIYYIGTSAFTDNTSLQNVVILTSTVYLANGGDVTNYPFRGCSNAALKVYVNGYVGLGESSSTYYIRAFAFNASEGADADTEARRVATYVNSTDSTEWLYIMANVATGAGEYTAYDLTIDMIEYLYNNGYCDVNLYVATDYMLINLKANSLTATGLAASLKAALEDAINAYTAETYGYINAYTVTVTVSGTDGISVSVTANEATEYYYPVTVTNYVGDSEDATNAYTVNYSDSYQSFTYTNTNNQSVTNTYLKSGASITLTGGTYGYTLTGVAYNGGTVSGDSTNGYTITAASSTAGSALKLTWTEVTYTHGIKVQSAISFYYGTDTTQVLNADTEYTVEADSLATATAATESNCYFLGWAYVSGSDLVFASTASSTETTYYAIWGYASETISSYSVTDSSSSLNDPTLGSTSTGAEFYKWYADSSFSTEVSSISTTQTVVYARMKYTISYYYYGDHNNKAYYVDYNKQTSTYADLLRRGDNNYYIYEGSYIYIYTSQYTTSYGTSKGYTIDIYDSYSAYKDANITYYQQHTLYVYYTVLLSYTGYTTSFLADWDYVSYDDSKGSNQSSTSTYTTTYYDETTYASFATTSKWVSGDNGAYYISYVGHSTTVALSY